MRLLNKGHYVCVCVCESKKYMVDQAINYLLPRDFEFSTRRFVDESRELTAENCAKESRSFVYRKLKIKF